MASWPIVSVGLCGVLGYLEAAIILGSVNLWYNVVVIYATLFAGLIPIEMLIRWGAGSTFGVSDAHATPGISRSIHAGFRHDRPSRN
jgi:hypothetical protein